LTAARYDSVAPERRIGSQLRGLSTVSRKCASVLMALISRPLGHWHNSYNAGKPAFTFYPWTSQIGSTIVTTYMFNANGCTLICIDALPSFTAMSFAAQQ